MVRNCSKAPGKVILFGEHFVVKGMPAIAAAVNLFAETCFEQSSVDNYLVESRQLMLKIDLRNKDVPDAFLPFKRIVEIVESKYGRIKPFKAIINSEIPVAAGMGSSAAVSVSFTKALLDYMGVEYDLGDINCIAFEAEKLVHRKPSGIDNTIAVYGGVIYYVKGSMERLNVKWSNEYALIVADTGVKRNTGQVVQAVLERYDRHPDIMEKVYDAAKQLVNKAKMLLEQGKIAPLGELMNINHGLLVSIGVAIPETEVLVHNILRNGGLGAKISGAGSGGIVIGVINRDKVDAVVESIKKYARNLWVLSIDNEGVR